MPFYNRNIKNSKSIVLLNTNLNSHNINKNNSKNMTN